MVVKKVRKIHESRFSVMSSQRSIAESTHRQVLRIPADSQVLQLPSVRLPGQPHRVGRSEGSRKRTGGPARMCLFMRDIQTRDGRSERSGR